MSDDLRFPNGPFRRPSSLTPAERERFIAQLAAQPAALSAVLAGLDDAQLDTPYRPGGWTVRQLAHHVPDSHLNMYIRLKLALTESNPTIKPYDQDAWVTLADVRTVPVATSMALFAAIHKRAVAVFRAMTAEDFARTFMHPESGKTNLDQLLALYAWHGDHHVAHVKELSERAAWP